MTDDDVDARIPIPAEEGNGQSSLDIQSVVTPSTVHRNIQEHTLSGLSDLDSSIPHPELITQPLIPAQTASFAVCISAEKF